MTIDDQIRDEILQYNINREAAKISGLSSNKFNNKQILRGHSLIIKTYPLEVGNIQRGPAELNIISRRMDKSYIQQEWACYVCFIIYLLTFL